jgi:hypothetical protein
MTSRLIRDYINRIDSMYNIDGKTCGVRLQVNPNPNPSSRTRVQRLGAPLTPIGHLARKVALLFRVFEALAKSDRPTNCAPAPTIIQPHLRSGSSPIQDLLSIERASSETCALF